MFWNKFSSRVILGCSIAIPLTIFFYSLQNLNATESNSIFLQKIVDSFGARKDKDGSRKEKLCFISPRKTLNSQRPLHVTTSGYPVFAWDGAVRNMSITNINVEDSAIEITKAQRPDIFNRGFWMYEGEGNQGKALQPGTYRLKFQLENLSQGSFLFEIRNSDYLEPLLHENNISSVINSEQVFELITKLESDNRLTWDIDIITYRVIERELQNLEFQENFKKIIQEKFCPE